MLDKVLHNRWPRVGAALFGSLLLALAINLFIVPQHLYSSGLLGLCQVIRTLLDTKLGIRFDNFDLAGTLYLAANLPLLLLAYKTMGRSFVAMLALCTVSNSVFLSIIPIPATPIISDVLTSCLVGGILAGFSNGLVLTCGASCGGLDILGLYLSKKTKGFTVGRFSLLFNAVLYYPGCVLLRLWLPKYEVSVSYLGMLLPLIIYTSKVSLLTNNYLKAYQQERTMLRINASCVAAGLALFALEAWVLNSLTAVLLLVLLSVMLRSMLSEAAVMRIIHVDLRREFVIEFALTAVFLISTCLLPYWWGLGVYGAALGGYLLGKRRDLRQLAHTLRRT